jgi:parallel beta-helix repeat protein
MNIVAGACGLAAAAAVSLVVAAGASATVAATTLWVSVGGSDGNSCTQPAPCRTISHAVSVANPGDTVIVEPGTYTEDVVVAKSLTISGEAGAVVDATGQVNCFDVSGPGASGTVLEGFTVENAIGEGILVESTSTVTVQHNELHANDVGFNTNATPECAAQGNVPGDCGEALHLMSVTGGRVIDNTVENNVGGILVTDEAGPSSGNLISGNVARDNLEDCGITLPSHNPMAMASPALGGVYDNTVTGNLSEGNGGAGVGMFAPFPGAAAYDNTVSRNRLLDNGEAGIAIHAHAPFQNVSGNVITFNVVSGNGVDPDSGSGNPTGIALLAAVDPQSTTIGGNRISNEYYGIFAAGAFSVSLPYANFMSNVRVRFGRGPVPTG